MTHAEWFTLVGVSVAVLSAVVAAIRYLIGYIRTLQAEAATAAAALERQRLQREYEQAEDSRRFVALEKQLATAHKSSTIPPSDPSRKAAARSAGFRPGDTASFERANSIGDMRCNGHGEVLESSRRAVAASEATAATVRAEGEATRGMIKELADSIGNIREWKGEITGRMTAAERDIGRNRTLLEKAAG